MEEYKPTGKCKKCGCGKAATKYMGRSFSANGDEDYLLRTCERCSYVWKEEPLNRGLSDD